MRFCSTRTCLMVMPRDSRLVRKNHILISILVILGNSGVNEKNTALDAGADSYLTEPFDRCELMADLGAIMRRTFGYSSATILVSNLVVDLSRNYPKAGETWLELTAKEFRIIEFLALRRGAVLSIDALLNHLYGDIDDRETNIILAFICKLRRKLAENGAKGLCVEEVWRQGYIRREPPFIWCCKKWASVHPLFIEAVPAPSNSSLVWTGLAHSLTTTQSVSVF